MGNHYHDYYTFDRSLKIGDIVFGYRKGIWKIEEIIDWSYKRYNNTNIQMNNQFKLLMICKSDGSLPKKKIYDTCDGRNVKKAIDCLNEEMSNLEKLKAIVIDHEKKA